MSSANVFLKMALLSPEPATPVHLVRHAAVRRQVNGQTPLGSINGDRYAALKEITNLA